MKWMEKILDMFMPLDPIRMPEQRDKPVTARATKPDNVVYVAGRAFVNRDTADGFEQTRYRGVDATRLEELTDQDRRDLALSGLSEVKAAELKPLWARGLSAARIAGTEKGRGKGTRTVEKYLAVFNRNHSPIAAGEG